MYIKIPLQKLKTKLKDPNLNSKQSNTVYKILCKDFNKNYTGVSQTTFKYANDIYTTKKYN